MKTTVGNWQNASGSVEQNCPSQRINQGHKSWVSTTCIVTRGETSWIQFQCRHYFRCIAEQQNCYILAKQWGKAPKTFYMLFLESQGSSRIILQRKTEHLGGMGTFLRTARSRTARNNCQKQINNSKEQLPMLNDSKISQD